MSLFHNRKLITRTYQNKRFNQYTNNQRRNPDVDIPFGVISGYGSDSVGFIVNMSNDMSLIGQYKFQIVIKDMVVPYSSGGITPTTLTISSDGRTILPNPHTHTVSTGVSTVVSSIANFRVIWNGLDITNALILQANDMEGGRWVNSNGNFPVENDIDDEFYFDLQEVANFWHDDEAKREVILRPGKKNVVFTNEGGVFGFDFIYKIKNSFQND